MATPIPDNSASFTLREVAEATGGRVAGDLRLRVAGVVTDSRKDVAGRLFVALRGDSFDGHAFLPRVLAQGAAAVLAEDDGASDMPGVHVADTLVALGDLAAWHRRRWGGRVVAIGGSAGKTTTRCATSALLRPLLGDELHFERGNLNNLIGVPMVLLGLSDAHRVAVVEVGTNRAGEVAALAEICRPDVVVLTLVDLEHTEGLGDLAGVEAEEGELLRFRGFDGVAIGNLDDARVARLLRDSPARTRLGYGRNPEAEYRIVRRTLLDVHRSRVTVRRGGAEVSFETALAGEPGALACTAALAVAEALLGAPVPIEVLQEAFVGPDVGEPGRLVSHELPDGTLLLDDTYNANPASVRSSVAYALELARSRGVRCGLVIGEMRELGGLSRAEHEALGESLGSSGAAWLVAIAGDAQRTAEAAQGAGVSAFFAQNSELALELVQERLNARDVVLVKASRGIRAERVIEGLLRCATSGERQGVPE